VYVHLLLGLNAVLKQIKRSRTLRLLVSDSDVRQTVNLLAPCVLYIGRPRSATIQMLHFIYFFNKYKY
jgi:hypothetical protein